MSFTENKIILVKQTVCDTNTETVGILMSDSSKNDNFGLHFLFRQMFIGAVKRLHRFHFMKLLMVLKNTE